MHVHVHVIIYSELFEVWGAGDFPPLKLRFLSLNFLKLIIIIHVQTVLNYGKLPLCPPPLLANLEFLNPSSFTLCLQYCVTFP